jgi:hypothetical protein
VVMIVGDIYQFTIWWHDLNFPLGSHNKDTACLAAFIVVSRSAFVSERPWILASKKETTALYQFFLLVWCHQTSCKIWYEVVKVDLYASVVFVMSKA